MSNQLLKRCPKCGKMIEARMLDRHTQSHLDRSFRALMAQQKEKGNRGGDSYEQ